VAVQLHAVDLKCPGTKPPTAVCSNGDSQ